MPSYPESSPDVFVEYLQKSRLVSPEELNDALEAWNDPANQRHGKTLSSLTSLLIGRGLITDWQAAKLREHKYKGFYLDHYVLLDCLGASNESARYLARDTGIDTLHVAVVYPPGNRSTLDNIRYDIEDL